MLGLTIQTIGELFIAYTVIRVHHRVAKEKKIDRKVLRAFRHEQFLGISGMILIITGFLIQILLGS